MKPWPYKPVNKPSGRPHGVLATNPHSQNPTSALRGPENSPRVENGEACRPLCDEGSTRETSKTVTKFARDTVCYGPVTDRRNIPKSLKTKVFIIYICILLQINKYISTHTHIHARTHIETHLSGESRNAVTRLIYIEYFRYGKISVTQHLPLLGFQGLE